MEGRWDSSVWLLWGTLSNRHWKGQNKDTRQKVDEEKGSLDYLPSPPDISNFYELSKTQCPSNMTDASTNRSRTHEMHQRRQNSRQSFFRRCLTAIARTLTKGAHGSIYACFFIISVFCLSILVSGCGVMRLETCWLFHISWCTWKVNLGVKIWKKWCAILVGTYFYVTELYLSYPVFFDLYHGSIIFVFLSSRKFLYMSDDNRVACICDLGNLCLVTYLCGFVLKVILLFLFLNLWLRFFETISSLFILLFSLAFPWPHHPFHWIVMCFRFLRFLRLGGLDLWSMLYLTTYVTCFFLCFGSL